MPDRVRVEPAGIELDAHRGETIMECAWRHGYEWPTVCGGKGSCRACYVTVVGDGGGLTAPGRLESEGIAAVVAGGAAGARPVRLACQARVQGEVVVEKLGVRAGAGARPGRKTEED